MYQFKDLSSTNNTPYTSSVAMTWDGQLLENLIPGYKTLNVEGRGLVDNHLSFHPHVPGRDGDLVSSETIKSRYLTIQYEIKAGDSASLRGAYNKLNMALRNADKEVTVISFADEPDYFFYGRFSDAVEPDPSTNNPVGYFRVLCEDPFKYGPKVALSSLSTEDENVYPLKLETLQLSVPSNASKITILNQTTGRRIILNGTYTAGQTLLITDGKITLNGQNIKNNLDYIASDWHQFTLHAGDVISTTPATTPMILVRRRLL